MSQGNDERAELVVDARGHRCPVPTLRLRRAVETAPPGTVLRLIADDPMARVDAPHYATLAGLDLLGVDEIEGRLEIRVRTPAPGRRRAVGDTTRRQRTN